MFAMRLGTDSYETALVLTLMNNSDVSGIIVKLDGATTFIKKDGRNLCTHKYFNSP